MNNVKITHIISDNNSVQNESHDTNIDSIKMIISIAIHMIATAGNHFFIFISHLLMIKIRAAHTKVIINKNNTRAAPLSSDKAMIHKINHIIA